MYRSQCAFLHCRANTNIITAAYVFLINGKIAKNTKAGIFVPDCPASNGEYDCGGLTAPLLSKQRRELFYDQHFNRQFRSSSTNTQVLTVDNEFLRGDELPEKCTSAACSELVCAASAEQLAQLPCLAKLHESVLPIALTPHQEEYNAETSYFQDQQQAR